MRWVLDGRMMMRQIYGRVQNFMTEEILGLDIFRILRRWLLVPC